MPWGPKIHFWIPTINFWITQIRFVPAFSGARFGTKNKWDDAIYSRMVLGELELGAL